jgi:hypothetical protein
MSDAFPSSAPTTIHHPGARFAADPPRCRVEDGIYFADGRVVLLEVASGVVHVHETTTLAALDDEAPEDWIDLDRTVRGSAGGYVASGGGTAWESEAWVALQAADDDALIWLVKLEGVDAVTQLRCDGDTIVARSEAYPYIVEWFIPILDPEAMVIERRRWEPAIQAMQVAT